VNIGDENGHLDLTAAAVIRNETGLIYTRMDRPHAMCTDVDVRDVWRQLQVQTRTHSQEDGGNTRWSDSFFI